MSSQAARLQVCRQAGGLHILFPYSMPEPNKETIERSLRLLGQPGDTVELRCLGDRTISGYYRDWTKLAADAASLNSSSFHPPQNVYCTLNPVQPDLFARRADQYGYCRKGDGAKDSDIVCRRWLLIDVDAVRPSGVSASDPQKKFSVELARVVYARLCDQLGNSSIVCADSGNGMHLLIRLPDVENSQQSRWVCERFLQLLDQQFSSDTAKVDRATHNAGRIGPLYGTVKRKGSDIPEQPHRLTKLLHVPDPLQPADWEQLAALVDPYPGDQPAPPPPASADHLGIDGLLQQRGVPYSTSESESQSGERWTKYELDCPFSNEHEDGFAIFRWENGAVAAKCHHDSCQGKGWPELKAIWGLPVGNGVTASDIILPIEPPRMSPMSSPPVSSLSSSPLDSHIDPPADPADAYYGPLGEICADLRRYTEAAPIAVLACSLLQFCAAIGRAAFVRLDEPHFAKLYIALVGATGAGRKGTADSQAARIIAAIDPTSELRQFSGLSTGEGLLQILDDNRDGLLPRPAVFTEREFAAVFRRAERKGNTLSPFIRDAWDGKPLANSTKDNPLRVADHHVCLSAHCTPAELKRLLSSLEVANGFANRFIWVHCRRTDLKPNARGFDASLYPRQIQRLQDSLEAVRERSRQAGGPVEMSLTEQASNAWRDRFYPQLDIDSDEDTQLTLMCNRQPQQMVRLAMIFAIADGAQQIDLPHLEAGRAIVEYVRDSLDYILSRPWWGDSNNAHDPAGMAETAMQALAEGPKPRSHITRVVFQRNRTAREINAMRDLLLQQGRLRIEQDGRSEVWSVP